MEPVGFWLTRGVCVLHQVRKRQVEQLRHGAGLDSAAYLLLFHAVAVLGAAALVQQGLLWPPATLVAMAGYVLGGALFAGDVSMRAFAGHRLFPMAAPTGGTILIVSWLVLALAAFVIILRGR